MGWTHHLVRLASLILLSGFSLQLFFAGRVALMIGINPQSTTFQRSEAWRLSNTARSKPWRQAWVPYTQISNHLKRAVITSEDAGFAEHSGVEWEALEKAWERNQKAQARADQLNDQLAKKAERLLNGAPATTTASIERLKVEPKIMGGSTISQQLAKNLFLASERSFARKAQEFVITLMLERMLSKRRLLEIYLNNVEWGEGVFGAQAAANYYYRVNAGQLSAGQAARLAVMLPAPKRFEKKPDSAYLASRASTVLNRMNSSELP